MSRSYFLASGIGDAERAHIAAAAAILTPSLVPMIDWPGLILLADARLPAMRAGDGAILGTVYEKGRREPLNRSPAPVAASIATSRGEHLVRSYWGNYVALFPSNTGVAMVRAPLGSLPCLYASRDGKIIAASHVDLLSRLGGYRASVDWTAVARFIASPDVRMAETCLAGLSELRGGDRLLVERAGRGLDTLWSPWEFCSRSRQLEDPDEAAAALRDAILAATRSTASTSKRSAILLSGGLDSSIVAASAAAEGLTASCITISTDLPSGDEREFARSTARRSGLALFERSFALDAIALDRSEAAHLPRPVARAFECEGRRQARQVAAEIGVDTLFSGGGGDNVFCALQSVAPAVDAFDRFGPRAPFWRVARELSRITGASVPTVARRAWVRSWQKGRQFPPPVENQFMSASACACARAAPIHPWLKRPRSVLQGKGAHVAALLGVQTLTEDTDPDDPLALRYPLLAQPVVELCLNIPTWLWYDRGCNRAVARHGFEQHLPPEIAWRRSKGTPDSFIVEIYDAKRAQIREMLTGGTLAAHDLLDVPALLAVLDDLRPVRGSNHGRIMRLVDVEAWARTWPD